MEYGPPGHFGFEEKLWENQLAETEEDRQHWKGEDEIPEAESLLPKTRSCIEDTSNPKFCLHQMPNTSDPMLYPTRSRSYLSPV